MLKIGDFNMARPTKDSTPVNVKMDTESNL